LVWIEEVESKNNNWSEK